MPKESAAFGENIKITLTGPSGEVKAVRHVGGTPNKLSLTDLLNVQYCPCCGEHLTLAPIFVCTQGCGQRFMLKIGEKPIMIFIGKEEA